MVENENQSKCLTSHSFCYVNECQTVPELVDKLVSHHQLFLKPAIAGMRFTARQIKRKCEPMNESLAKVIFYFEELANNQMEHMSHEETILFPYIKSLYRKPQKESGLQLKKPFYMLEEEHEHAAEDLEYLRAHSNNFTAPENACYLIRGFFKDLKIMEQDLLLHQYIEDNILHPRVLQKEAQDSLSAFV